MICVVHLHDFIHCDCIYAYKMFIFHPSTVNNYAFEKNLIPFFCNSNKVFYIFNKIITYVFNGILHFITALLWCIKPCFVRPKSIPNIVSNASIGNSSQPDANQANEKIRMVSCCHFTASRRGFYIGKFISPNWIMQKDSQHRVFIALFVDRLKTQTNSIEFHWVEAFFPYEMSLILTPPWI